MSIKKLLVLAAAGMASSAALAGTVAYTAKPTSTAPVVNDNVGVYVEGMAGYNRHALKDAFPSVADVDWSDGNGNWAFGADIGYQFQRYLSAELGGIYTLRTKASHADDSLKYKPWYAYLAAKVAVPVYDNISVFTKLGLGYQKAKVTGDLAGVAVSKTGDNWGPMFGAGIAYNVTPEFYIKGEWDRFTGKIKNGELVTTAPNIFLLGVGYKFAI